MSCAALLFAKPSSGKEGLIFYKTFIIAQNLYIIYIKVTEIIKFSFQAWISARNPLILVVSGISSILLNRNVLAQILSLLLYKEALSHIRGY